jgi:23S rRNA U2552 (ribose-2'-O)-methylase RlmE/FtsJ
MEKATRSFNPYEALQEFALDHYEEGGHWVVECFGKEDYDRFLAKTSSVAEAREELQKYWTLIEEQAREIRSM